MMYEDLEDIVESALEAKEVLERFMNSTASFGDVRAKWMSWSPSGTSKSCDRILSSDGSSSSLPAGPGNIVFAISAAVFGMVDQSPVKLRRYQIGLLDRFKPEDRIRILRSTLELKLTVKSAERVNPEVVLLDGSLISLTKEPMFVGLMRGKEGLYLLDESERVEIVDRIKNELPLEKFLRESDKVYTADMNTYMDRWSAAIRIAGDFSESSLEVSRLEWLIMSLMERVEHFMVLSRLLSLPGDVRVIAISKRSSSKELFRRFAPDISLISAYTRETGFTSPMIEEVKLPKYFQDRICRKVTVFYARLHEKANPLRIEVLGELDQGSISEVLDFLSTISVNGYPYHLRMSHEMAKITRGHLRAVRGVLGSDFWKMCFLSGREMLGERF